MNSNTRYPHGQNQIPFDNVPRGAPFIDAEFGGVWISRGPEHAPICIEDDSAYVIGSETRFKPDSPVYLCTRGNDGWVELFEVAPEVEAPKAKDSVIITKLENAEEALRVISLADMRPTPDMSDEAISVWHASKAWEFIGIAAQTLSKNINLGKKSK
jgi:hypothetical protein